MTLNHVTSTTCNHWHPKTAQRTMSFNTRFHCLLTNFELNPWAKEDKHNMVWSIGVANNMHNLQQSWPVLGNLKVAVESQSGDFHTTMTDGQNRLLYPLCM